MEKFCFGALARILLYCSKLGVKQYELGESLLKVFDAAYGETVDDTKVSKLFNCAEGLSRDYTVAPAENMPIEEVKVGFCLHVLPLLDENKYPLIILAAKQIILMDGDIKDGTSIGIMTKGELKTKTSFDFIGTVAGFLKYSCYCFKNHAGKEFIDQVTPNFVEEFKKNADTITIEKIVVIPTDKIDKTVEPDTFLQSLFMKSTRISHWVKKTTINLGYSDWNVTKVNIHMMLLMIFCLIISEHMCIHVRI